MQPATKTSLMRAIERAHGGKDIRKIIQDRFRELGSKEAVAEELGISRYGLETWIQRFGGDTQVDLVFPSFSEEQPLAEVA